MEAILENVGFTIYIPDDSEFTLHVSDVSNTSGHITYLTGYLSTDYLFHNNYFNPNFVYNPYIYGSWYNGTTRVIYEEELNAVPPGAAFNVLKGSDTSATRLSEVSTVANIVGSSMRIDHPLLNGNPDAVFLFNHYWGFPDGENSTYLTAITEAYYYSDYWHIYNYDGNFPLNVWIDIIIPDQILGVDEMDHTMDKISIYPNPMKDVANFRSKADITEIILHTMSGQIILTSKEKGKNIQLNVSSLSPGIYIAKIKTDKGWSSEKLMKN